VGVAVLVLAWVVTAVVTAAAATSGTGTISGTVVRKSSKWPKDRVFATVAAVDYMPRWSGIDKNGRFIIHDVPAGIRFLMIGGFEYCRVHRVVALAPGESIDVRVELREAPSTRLGTDHGARGYEYCGDRGFALHPLPSPDGLAWLAGSVVDRHSGGRVSGAALTIGDSYVHLAAEGAWFSESITDTASVVLRAWAPGYEAITRRIRPRSCCTDTMHFRLVREGVGD
jgi:hypothetical protein